MAITNSPRLGIERWSHGTDRHPPRAVWDAQQGILDDLVAIDRQYPTLAARPAAGVRGTYCWVEENTTLYRDDGSQWRPVVQFGGGAGAAVVAGGSGGEGSSARSARADHTHPLPLATGSAHGAMRSTDKALIDGATSSSTGNTLARRNAQGRVSFTQVSLDSAPSNGYDAATKAYVDDQAASVLVPNTISNSANLNLYTTPGVYMQNQHAGAANGTNYPVPSAGLLEVHTSGTFVFQRYTVSRLHSGPSADTVYRRTRYSNEWGPWQESARTAYVDEQAGLARFAGHLDGTDLDDVLDPGLYGLNAQANATTELNYPAEGIGGTLLVMRWAGAAVGSQAVTQMYQGRGANNRNRLWIRSKITATSTWSSWIELANTSLATTSSSGLMPSSDRALLNAATHNNTGGSLVRRTSAGDAALRTVYGLADPTSNDHATRKSYVDSRDTATLNSANTAATNALAPVKAKVDGATGEANGGTLVSRWSNGGAAFHSVNLSTAPTSTVHATRKDYVDAGDSSTLASAKSAADASLEPVKALTDAATFNPTPNTLARRDSSGRLRVATPNTTDGATPRSYVDATATSARAAAETTAANALAPVKALTDAATPNATANAIARRDGSGRLKVSDPSAAADATTKGYVDDRVNPLNSVVTAATANATANTIVRRDGSGRFKAANPSVATDVANRGFVEGLTSPLNTWVGDLDDRLFDAEYDLARANSALPINRAVLVRRDANGRAQFADPVTYAQAATKGYVDGLTNPLTYKSGARYVDSREMSGVSTARGRLTLVRVGPVVTASFSGWEGSLMGTGPAFWNDTGPLFAVPVGFRPESEVVNLVTATQGWRIEPSGAVSVRGAAAYQDSGGTITYVVESAPPASFTWGTAV